MRSVGAKEAAVEGVTGGWRQSCVSGTGRKDGPSRMCPKFTEEVEESLPIVRKLELNCEETFFKKINVLSGNLSSGIIKLNAIHFF